MPEPTPEMAAREAVYDLLVTDFADDHSVAVTWGIAGDLSRTKNIAVLGTSSDEEVASLRGPSRASVDVRFFVRLAIECADQGLEAIEVSRAATSLLGEVRGSIRTRVAAGGQLADNVWMGQVTRADSEGALPLDGGGYVEHYTVDVGCRARI